LPVNKENGGILMVIEAGQKMYAADILNLTFFPAGAILIFSSAAWSAASAEFKNIWKVCNAANHATNPIIPDLTNRFLRGADSSGATGGADSQSVTLTANNLPTHNHGLSEASLTSLTAQSAGAHEHLLSGKTALAGEHGHGINDSGHSHMYTHEPLGAANGLRHGNSDYITTSAQESTTSVQTGISIQKDGTHEQSFSSDSKAFSAGAHTHDVIGNISGSTANAGSSQAFSVDTVPSYYAVIYIMKAA
jgi:hypothetical protein